MTISSDCDLVLVNGNVVTVDPVFSVRSAVGMRGNRIVAVGSDDQIRRLIGSRTVLVDLKGKTVLPGINDSHSHTALWAGTRPPLVLDLSYPTVRSVAEILAEVKAMAQSLPPGEWVRGTGWDAGYLDECLKDPAFRQDRRLLDSVSPDNPVALADFSLHALWVNSKALELAGIGRDTPDPPGGVIEKDPGTGEPTGMLIEFAATQPRDGPHTTLDPRSEEAGCLHGSRRDECSGHNQHDRTGSRPRRGCVSGRSARLRVHRCLSRLCWTMSASR